MQCIVNLESDLLSTIYAVDVPIHPIFAPAEVQMSISFSGRMFSSLFPLIQPYPAFLSFLPCSLWTFFRCSAIHFYKLQINFSQLKLVYTHNNFHTAELKYFLHVWTLSNHNWKCLARSPTIVSTISAWIMNNDWKCSKMKTTNLRAILTKMYCTSYSF